MSRMVNTSKLPQLPILMYSANLSRKITIRSRLSMLQEINAWLIDSNKKVFKRYSQFGRLLDLPMEGQFCGALAHNLVMVRLIDCCASGTYLQRMLITNKSLSDGALDVSLNLFKHVVCSHPFHFFFFF